MAAPADTPAGSPAVGSSIPPWNLSGARGIDVSHWNGDLDWSALLAGGVQWAYAKCWEHSSPDPKWKENYAGAATAGLLTLPYVFLTPEDTSENVRACLAFLDEAAQLPLVLDWEEAGVSSSVVETWIAGVPRLPLAYYGISPPGLVTPKIAGCPRILPEYAGAPRLGPWDGVGPQDWERKWLIWQRTPAGKFQGNAGDFDLDQLAPGVSLKRFLAWCRTGSWEEAGA